MGKDPFLGCTCEDCKKMCERPCWGTPEDIEKIISADFTWGLMLDYWIGSPNNYHDDIKKTYIIAPAWKEYELKIAPYNSPNLPRTGGSFRRSSRKRVRCTFQNDEGLCILHDLGLKPTEGKLLVSSAHQESTKNKIELHRMIACTWETEKGLKLVEYFRKIIERR